MESAPTIDQLYQQTGGYGIYPYNMNFTVGNGLDRSVFIGIN